MEDVKIIKFSNCCLLRDHTIVKEDLWIRRGKILNPQTLFFSEKKAPDEIIDCWGALISPGFIDLQINGGFGTDFTHEKENVEQGVTVVAKGVVAHGVTAFLPTIVSSSPETYSTILPKLRKRMGGEEGAAVLGVHLEGPFISPLKKGAHDEKVLQSFPNGYETLKETYGRMHNVALLTLAPEIPNALDVITRVKKDYQKLIISIGHTNADMDTGLKAIECGASFITHLFNCMNLFHHRDPGLLGLVATVTDKPLTFGLIPDGLHTHPASIRIAHRVKPEGCVIVTDAISALGLPEGTHHLGVNKIDVRDGAAYISGTETLCGSIRPFNHCVKLFKTSTGCSLVEALEAGSLHPAKTLNIQKHKGTLNFGADADFILLNDNLDVIQTWVGGKCAYKNSAIEDHTFKYSVNFENSNNSYEDIFEKRVIRGSKTVYFNLNPEHIP
ncbi:N-acetylglucosamine-6-phosphate deacetylase [Lycorma delicatula]|uniref:N-acetylglucosamine-6-phosphate deacetylase n=1 Tax=Lycorma delicatula TaxID=130591 RepID=UPI003F517F32